MKSFVKLFKKIDQTNSSNQKINALVNYFEDANDDDKLWVVAIFTHRRPPRAVTTTLLRSLAAEVANLPIWLFEETYHIVGDLAETIALITPQQITNSDSSLTEVIEELIALKPKSEDEKRIFIKTKWAGLDSDAKFIFNKIITGGFRVGVSQKIMVKALAKYLNEEENVIAHRLMGNWNPTSINFQSLIVNPTEGEDQSKPYPFYLAYPLESDVSDLGDINQWSAEWKWDGIRGQIIKREGQLFVWSRGEDLVTEKFPEFNALLSEQAHDFVIDGEIIPLIDGKPLPFNKLQTRIGRKTVAKKHLIEVPIYMIAYDLLELNGQDLREKPLFERRQLLFDLVNNMDSDVIKISKDIVFTDWEELIKVKDTSRINHAEGLMLKLKNGSYKVGRKKGEWWKWKIDPLEIDAVMLYAQRGHGRRANLYTDFTFAVRDGDRLIPFTKAYSGLTDLEFKAVTKFVKKNTKERFGPVASVNPELVFTIAFEGIAKFKRHKCGIALRFPRISRWRKDKSIKDIDTLDNLKGLLSAYG